MKYTNKQLEAMTDMEFAADIIREKLAKLCNPNSPFASKLRRTYHALCEQATQEKHIEQITAAAADEIWGSLEQGPTGNYWIDDTHNLSCVKEKEYYEDAYYEIQLQEVAIRGDEYNIVWIVDKSTTEGHSNPSSYEALKDVLRELVACHTHIYFDCHRKLASWLKELKESKALLRFAVADLYENAMCDNCKSAKECNPAVESKTCSYEWEHAEEVEKLIGGDFKWKI